MTGDRLPRWLDGVVEITAAADAQQVELWTLAVCSCSSSGLSGEAVSSIVPPREPLSVNDSR